MNAPRSLRRFGALSIHLGSTLRLAAPIVAAQLAMIGVRTTDTIMAGRLSQTDLAAVATGMSIWVTVALMFIGLANGLSAIVAQRQGRGDAHAGTGQLIQQGLWTALIAGAGLWMAIQLGSTPLVQALGLSAEAARMAAGYLHALSWSAPAFCALLVLRFAAEGMSTPRPFMEAAVIGLIANVWLNDTLMYGRYGLPALGGVGCGVASAIVDMLMLGWMLWAYRRHARLRPLRVFAVRVMPTRAFLRQWAHIGVPIGVMLTFEAGYFGAAGLLMAGLGDTAVASHQIALNVTAVCFMVPLSVAFASTVRVGNAVGAGRAGDARLAALSAVLLAGAFGIASASLMWLLPGQIAGLYTLDPVVRDAAVALLVWAALFQVFDCLQASAAGALRGYADVRLPMLITGLAYWGIGMPISVVFGFGWFGVAAVGGDGIWWGIVVSLGAAALLLNLRLVRVARLARASV